VFAQKEPILSEIMSVTPVLETLFTRHFGVPPESQTELSSQLGGSARRMIRLSGSGATAVGVLYDVREENVAFVEFSRHFRRHGLPVPEIYGADLDQNVYLEEDLGNTTLFEFQARNRSGAELRPEAMDAYRRVAGLLPRFQVAAARDLDYDVCYPRASFDRQSIVWDLNYFKYCFLRPACIGFNEQSLEDDFGRLTDLLLEADREYFLYRDFQARNIMLTERGPVFIDYQGGRKGALQYDIASLLYDARADLAPEVRHALLDTYLDALGDHVSLDRGQFMEHFYPYVYVRILQALGAYGYLGLIQGKSYFQRSVPYALRNLAWLMENRELAVPVPALFGVFRNMLASEKLCQLGTEGGAS